MHSKTIEQVFRELKTSKEGISQSEADERLKQYGFNELQKGKKESVLMLFVKQFKDFLTYLLLFAAAISFILSHALDGFAMLSIALLSAILGFMQEYKANKAIEALEKLTAPTARVIRGKEEKKIAAREIAPGDIILLEAGDIVPADCRIIEAINLKIDESSLTGESVASRKGSKEVGEDAAITEQSCMSFMTTSVTYGKGKCVAVGTGMNTEIGKIAKSLQTQEETMVPLQVKFKQMAKQIGIAVIILVSIVFIITLINKDPSLPLKTVVGSLLIFALSLAVAAIPNSLPAIVMISLAMGAKILAKKKMIVKKLSATESLGSVTIICTDKTGTITKNEMTVTQLYWDNKTIDVSGSGYNPAGKFSIKGKDTDPNHFELLLRVGCLCNNAKLVTEDEKYSIIGDPTEGSLIVLGKKANLDSAFSSKFSSVSELPFDSERKRMTVIFDNKINKKREAYVKGAPDILLEKCSQIFSNGKVRKINPSDKKKILEANNRFAADALRVLAFAYREISNTKGRKKEYDIESVEKDLIFIGLAGMIDPPRDEVKEAVLKCRKAGIRVMVITGDYAETAKAVAEQIGLYHEDDLVLTGAEIDKMSDEEMERKIEGIRIIARALPIQKLRIVDALQKKGHIVAMTGDGVNDAPALKRADIGIAMGITGTDVAKEVSEGILADDNFATIVNAVEEGRNVYDKIIKSTRYLLSCNAGEVVSVFASILTRLPLPLLPLQLLMMNLVTDGLPALALGTEHGDKNIMQRPPRDPKDKPINRQMLILIIVFGMLMGLGTFLLFKAYYVKTGNLAYSQTVAFTTLVILEMFAVFGSRSLEPFGKINPFSNKWVTFAVLSSVLIQLAIIYLKPMQTLFGTVPLAASDWIWIILISFAGYWIMETSKFFMKSNNNHLAKV